jgi:hypothetical protein
MEAMVHFSIMVAVQMKIFVWCVGLALLFSQLPQSAPQPKAGNARPQQNAKPKTEVAPTPPAQPAPNPPNQEREHIAARNQPEIVRVESVKRDWLDIATLGLSTLLALIGIVAAYIALKTLAEIKKEVQHANIIAEAARDNVQATKDSADAALLNARAVINSERAWVDVTGIVNPEQGWIREENPERYRAVTGSDLGFCFFRVQNKGRTPAQFISGTIDHVFVRTANDLPIPPVYHSPFDAPNETFMTPDAHFDPRPFVNPKAIIQHREMADRILEPYQILIFYGQIIYEDVLGKASHETRWCYAWLDDRRVFVRTGPDGDGFKEYNRYT